jgi:hypothetical protein
MGGSHRGLSRGSSGGNEGGARCGQRSKASICGTTTAGRIWAQHGSSEETSGERSQGADILPSCQIKAEA